MSAKKNHTHVGCPRRAQHTVLTVLMMTSALALSGCTNETQPQPPAPQVVQLEAPAASEAGASEDGGATSAAPEVVLRTYPLPPGQREESAGILRSVLEADKDDGEPPIGRVSLSPDGQLVVVAPESIQAGVESFVDSLGDGASASADVEEPPVIRMTYWFVVAERGADTEAGVDDELAPVADALQKVPGHDGLRYRLLERVSLMTSNNEFASTDSREAEIRQRVSHRDGMTFADLEIGVRRGSRLDTRVRLDAGQTAILGQVGLPPELAVEGAEDLQGRERNLTLLYVVQAEVVDETAPATP